MADARLPRDVLERGLEKLYRAGTPAITAQAQDTLLALVELLLKWNRIYNLTAVRTAPAIVERHLLDSLVMSRWLPPPSSVAARLARWDVMDIGTGAGLPVLPLSIARPDLAFLSVESNGKKARFQQQALLELGIANVTVEQIRVETLSEQATTVISRAFTAPVDFLKIAEKLCVERGTVLVMLGTAERLPASLMPGYELVELVEVDVPGTESARHVAQCRRLIG